MWVGLVVKSAQNVKNFDGKSTAQLPQNILIIKQIFVIVQGNTKE